MDPFDDTVELYAVFEGGGGFERARSMQHDVTIAQDAFSPTSLTLVVPSTRISEGDVLPISGWLADERGNGIRDALIYIKDEDSGSGDDVIATVYTDTYGDFSYRWTARAMDPFDDTVEVYAVFEGSPDFGSSRSVQINIQIR